MIISAIIITRYHIRQCLVAYSSILSKTSRVSLNASGAIELLELITAPKRPNASVDLLTAAGSLGSMLFTSSA